MPRRVNNGKRLTKLQYIMVVCVISALVLILIGYWFSWTGFDAYTIPKSDTIEYVREKTLWDWLGLLVIPGVLAIGGYLFNKSEREQAQRRADERDKADKRRATLEKYKEQHRLALQQSLENQRAAERAEFERKHADERNKLEHARVDMQLKIDRENSAQAQREEALQHYIDRISELILDRELQQESPQLLKDVARARTLAVLQRLGNDGLRKGTILRFLHEAQLIQFEAPAIKLQNADLSDARLGVMDLHHVNLQRTNLRNANFQFSRLEQANLVGCQLQGVNFNRAVLKGSNLTGSIIATKWDFDPRKRVNMQRVDLTNATVVRTSMFGVDLTKAKLCKAKLLHSELESANLTDADLTEADLTNVDLTNADLTGAIVTEEQLATAKSLAGAKMPDGTTHS